MHICFYFIFLKKLFSGEKNLLAEEIWTNQITLSGEIFEWIYFRQSIFLTIHVDLISRIGYRLIFREDLFLQILVLSMFYIFWFFRGLLFNK